MGSNYDIIWTYTAKQSLDKIYEYIKKDSKKNAKKVKNEIVNTVTELKILPEKYPKEFYLDQEKGNFRFFVKWSYKIIYELTKKEIIILDIFHTAQNPDKINLLTDKK